MLLVHIMLCVCVDECMRKLGCCPFSTLPVLDSGYGLCEFAFCNMKHDFFRQAGASFYSRHLTLLQAEWPKLYGVLAILSATGLNTLLLNTT